MSTHKSLTISRKRRGPYLPKRLRVDCRLHRGVSQHDLRLQLGSELEP